MDDQTVADFLRTARQYLDTKKLLEQKMAALYDSLFSAGPSLGAAARPQSTSRPEQPVDGTTFEDVWRRTANNVDYTMILTSCICRMLFYESTADRRPAAACACRCSAATATKSEAAAQEYAPADKIKRPRRRPRPTAATPSSATPSAFASSSASTRSGRQR